MDPPDHQTIRTPDGVAIRLHDLGGSGPLVVFAHATGLHGMVWAPVASHLSDAFHCVSFDERGHGGSHRPAGDDGLDWRNFAVDVLAVVDHASAAAAPQPVVGVGHSSGGAALLLAEQARPGTFAGLYCFEPVIVAADPPLGRDPDNWLAAGARRRREVFASRRHARDHYRAKHPFTSWTPEALAAYVEHGFDDLGDGRVRLSCRGETEAVVYEMASAHDGFARLAEVSCPVALVSGAGTDAVGPASIATLAGRLPHARTEVIAGVGHFGPLEDPAAVAASIRAFAAAATR